MSKRCLYPLGLKGSLLFRAQTGLLSKTRYRALKAEDQKNRTNETDPSLVREKILISSCYYVIPKAFMKVKKMHAHFLMATFSVKSFSQESAAYPYTRKNPAIISNPFR